MNYRALLCLILVAVICFWGLSFLISDDDEDVRDLFTDSGRGINDHGLFPLQALDNSQKFYTLCEKFLPYQPSISFLAQHEKSPPALFRGNYEVLS